MKEHFAARSLIIVVFVVQANNINYSVILRIFSRVTRRPIDNFYSIVLVIVIMQNLFFFKT